MRALTVIAAIAMCAFACTEDDYMVWGGTPRLGKVGSAKVHIVSEEVNAEVDLLEVRFECIYKLSCPTVGVAKLAFPDYGAGTELQNYNDELEAMAAQNQIAKPYSGLQFFTMTVDGKEVELQVAKGEGAASWHGTTIPVGPAAARVVKVTYRVRIGKAIPQAGGSLATFGYDFAGEKTFAGQPDKVITTVKFIPESFDGKAAPKTTSELGSPPLEFRDWPSLPSAAIIYNGVPAGPTALEKGLSWTQEKPAKANLFQIWFKYTATS